jgi:integrase
MDFKIVIPSVERHKKKITIKTLPIPEIDIIIAAAPKPYDLMIKCIFKIGAGLRVSEAIRLSWSNFKWANWLEDKGIGGVEIKNSKSGDDLTTVPKALMEEIYEYANEKKILNEFGIPIGGMLFNFNKCYNGEYKKELRQHNLERWKDLYLHHAYGWFRNNILKKHCEKAVCHPIRIHSLRHTRATYLLDVEDVPIEILQKLLRHKVITTTMIYAQVSNKKVFNAMKNID